MRDVIIICRLKSRTGIDAYRRLHDELPKRGVSITAAHTVKKRKEFTRAVRNAVKAGAGYIVVVGGDGTQTAAVAELAKTSSVLAVVPSGTGNSFALGIGIKDIDTAIEAIATGHEQRIDVGVVNGICFANFATVGLMANAAAQTSQPLKRVLGPVAYGFSFLRDLFHGKPFRMKVTWRGGTLRLNTHQAIVANGRYFGWQPITPEADIRSGELAFFAIEGASRADALKESAALLAGQQTKLAGAHYFSALKIEIRTKPRQRLNIDGHDLGKTPAKFKIHPKALRVLVP